MLKELKDLEDLREHGILDELAKVFHTLDAAKRLVESVDFPLHEVPDGGGHSLDRWRDICREILHGKTVLGMGALLRAAAEEYPGNTVFQPWRTWGDEPSAEQDTPSADAEEPRKTSEPREEEDDEDEALEVRRTLRGRTAGKVSNSIEKAAGIDVLLTVPVDDDVEDLTTYVEQWLRRDDAPPVLILSGPMGSGKTIATCQLLRRLQSVPVPHEQPPVDLWVPFENTIGLAEDPDVAIRTYLGIDPTVDLWLPETGVRLFILDGLDEGLTVKKERVFQWLASLFKRASDTLSRPRFLISGRDVALDQMRDLFRALAAAQSLGAHKRPAELCLKEWDQDEAYYTLEEELARQVGTEEASRLVRLVWPEALNSPLLFGLAFDILAGQGSVRGLRGRARPIRTPADLIAHWIDDIVHKNYLRHPGRPGKLGPEDRLQVARVIALLLAVSGRGMSGATIEELEESPVLQRLWFDTAETSDRREEITWELKVGCLLSCQGRHFAPFHHAILVHLAAQALDGTILYTDEETSGTSPGLPPGKLIHEDDPKIVVDGTLADAVRAVARVPASRVSASQAMTELTERLETLFHERTLRLTDSAVQSGSFLEETLGHWVDQRVEPGEVPPLDLRTRSLDLEDDDVRLRTSVQVLVRDVLARRGHESPEPSRSSAWKIPRLDVPHCDFIEIPAGPYPVWRVDDRYRYLSTTELPRVVLLSRRLCSVEEYAAYLNDYPGHDLPSADEVRWSWSGDVADYDPLARDSPVTGISLQEARDYCRWLSKRIARHPENPVVSCRLPDPDWLRIAAWGPELREVSRHRAGPYGHDQLICHCWQWTEGHGRGSECLVFGGSRDLGGGEAPDKLLVRGWPDLCRPVAVTLRDPAQGFRVAIEVPDSAEDGKGRS